MSDDDERKVGRPSLLTAETRGRLLEALREGVSRQGACEFAGLSYSTLARWLRKGREDETGEFYELGLELREAEASVELEVLAQVRRDLPGDPKAALLLLA